jgi:hypothetical protein
MMDKCPLMRALESPSLPEIERFMRFYINNTGLQNKSY